MFKVLSVDGGGIRGVICGQVLDYIETQKGQPICELFDMVVGTSVGSLCGALLTLEDPLNPGQPKHTAARLIQLLSDPQYTNKIFQPYSGSIWQKLQQWLIRQVLRLAGQPVGAAQGAPLPYYYGLLHPLYSGDSLDSFISVDAEMGATLLSAALKPTVCTTWDVKNGGFVLLSSWGMDPNQPTALTFTEAIRASASPPVMIPIKTINRGGGQRYWLVDGGVACTNPVYEALAAALDYHQQFLGWNVAAALPDILLVSLGTGETAASPVNPLLPKFPDWGAAQWLPNEVLQLLFEAPIAVTESSAEMIFDRISQVDYDRFQPGLGGASERADDIRPANMAALMAAGNAFITDPPTKARLDAMIAKL